MNTFFIHHRSLHHATNSGYSRLVDFYKQSQTVLGKSDMPYKVAKTIASFANQDAGLYNAASVFKELELFKELRASKSHKNVVHYLNAERDIRYVVNRSKWFKNTFFCGSFHKPPSILEAYFKKDRYIKQLNGAIAVGRNQVDYIQNRFKIKNVVYIPHGVDTDFFTPKIPLNKQLTLLFVGQHLRDFDAFNKAIPIISNQIPNLKIQVVIHKAYFKLIKPRADMQIFSDLDDCALRVKYQEASLLFLPMLDSTACNSILEAMACGLPIITTDVGANRDYLSGSQAILAPANDNSYLIDATISLLENDQQLKEIAIKTRQHALQYNWKHIAGLVSEFHESLF